MHRKPTITRRALALLGRRIALRAKRRDWRGVAWSVGGFAAVVRAAWYLGPGFGWLAVGVSCLIMERLTGRD